MKTQKAFKIFNTEQKKFLKVSCNLQRFGICISILTRLFEFSFLHVHVLILGLGWAS